MRIRCMVRCWRAAAGVGVMWRSVELVAEMGRWTWLVMDEVLKLLLELGHGYRVRLPTVNASFWWTSRRAPLVK